MLIEYVSIVKYSKTSIRYFSLWCLDIELQLLYIYQKAKNVRLCKKDSNNRTYFYVDADTGLLYQKEEGQYYNSTFTPYYKYNYTYSYDTVTDEDIFVFNIENYPDYIYTEEQ